MSPTLSVALFLSLAGTPLLQTVTFEGDFFPEQVGWERVAFTEIDRSLVDGFFVQFVDETNEIDAYRRSLSDFSGKEKFFIEWRVETDAPAEILDSSGVPAVLSAGGTSAAFYHTTVTDTRVQLFRDTSIPLVFVDIDPGTPHTYRLELFGEELYAWYIDGQVVDTGVAQGRYPNPDSSLIWGARRQTFDATTRWDYVRYGTIPVDGSGDFDSDSDLDLRDYYFVRECLSNSGPDIDAGPGCRFADFDENTTVDLRDIATFQNDFTPSP